MSSPVRPARLHVVSGKGGTGKTTVAAAIAIALASGGKRTLLVEVEGRQGIAQLFDTAPLPYEEKRVAVAPGRGEVYALAVDVEAAMLDYLELFYNMKRAARALRRMGAVDFVTTIAPGLRDVLLTGKVKETVTRTGPEGRPYYDAVVLDAPPTGRINRFLDTTREVSKLTKMGPIHKQSEGVVQLLHSAQTSVHLVTLLEEMPVQETVDAAAVLADAGFALGAIIVNRARQDVVTESKAPISRRKSKANPDGGPSVDTEVLAEGLAQAGIDPQCAPALAIELVSYARTQQANASARTLLDDLDLPILTLPELAPPIDLGSLFELAATLRTALVPNGASA